MTAAPPGNGVADPAIPAMATPIRLGILGLAHYHAHFWLDAWTHHTLARVVGLWDADPARAAEAAFRHGVPAFAALPDLLAATDAVGICSETADHPALIEAAAAAGRAVFCEKPVAADAAGLARIRAAVAAAGIPFGISFPKRTDPVNAALRGLLAEGAVGRPFLARVRHGHGHGADPAFTAGWWADPARSGGGTLLDEGVHAADLLRWLFGDPAEAVALLGRADPALGVEDVAVAVWRWPCGLIGEAVTAWRFVAAEASVEIYGTEGTILLSRVDLASRDADVPALRLARRGEGGFRTIPAETAFPTGRFHQRSADAFVDSLAAGTPPPAGLEDAAGALRMILSAYAAAGRATPS